MHTTGRSLPVALVGLGVLLLLLGLVLGMRPLDVHLQAVSGNTSKDMSLSCGSHLAPDRAPFEVRSAGTVEVGPGRYMPADAAERICSNRIERTALWAPWTLIIVGCALVPVGFVVLRRAPARHETSSAGPKS